MKLLLIPLTIMFLLTIFSLLGLSSGGFNSMSTSLQVGNEMYYDVSGHPIVYVSNLTNVYEPVELASDGGIPTSHVIFYNSSSMGHFLSWYLYFDTSGDQDQQVPYDKIGSLTGSQITTINVQNSIGFAALVMGIMALCFIVGLRIFGNGIAEFSVSAIIKGGAFIAIWGAMSVTSLRLFTEIPLYIGGITYVALTLMYLIGVLNQFGHPEDN